MRGKLGPILSGVGGFLLVLGILLNVYAYPRLATAPIDQDSVSILNGPNASVLAIEEVTGGGTEYVIDTELTTTAKTTGKVDLSEQEGDNIRVWHNATSTKSSDGIVRTRTVEQVAFDGFTGEAVESEHAWTEQVQGNPEAIDFKGLVFKFPFQTEQKTYEWWDSTLQTTYPAEFQREEEIDGLNTYVFVQTIEPEVWTQMEVPGDVVGESEDSVEADRTYSNIRTFWVEPETGVVIDREEQQGATLRVGDEDRTTITEVVASFSDETVAQNIEDYSSKASLLKMVRLTLPLVLGGLGVVLLVIGLVITRRRSEA